MSPRKTVWLGFLSAFLFIPLLSGCANFARSNAPLTFQQIYKEADYVAYITVVDVIRITKTKEKVHEVHRSLSGFVWLDETGKQYIFSACHIQRDRKMNIRRQNKDGSVDEFEGELKAEKITAHFQDELNIPPQELVLLGCDSLVDATLLAFKDKNFWFKKNFAVLGDSSKLNVADPVMALGSPLGYKWMGAVGHIMNLRIGKDFGYEGYKNGGLIVHSAMMNFGSSGGPLVNARGEVIGLNILIHGDVNQIGMANRINDVKAILKDLKNGVIR